MRLTWRSYFRPIIRKVRQEHPTATYRELNRHLRHRWDQLQLGPRQYYPYQVWRDEIQRQTGRKPPLKSHTPTPPHPNQLTLFP